MALAHKSASLAPTGTNAATGTSSLSLTAANMGAMADGDLLLLVVILKPDTATITTPTGWTQIQNVTGGAGSVGVDTGPCRIGVYERRSLPVGAVSVSMASSPSACMGQIICVSAAADAGFSLGSATGNDTTTGGAFSCTFGSDPGITANDLVYVFGACPTDVNTGANFSAETLTATGVTFGSLTETSEPNTSQGNDAGGVICRWPVSSGTSSAAAAFSSTVATSTNVAGPLVLVRVREVAAANQPPITVTQLRAA